MPCVEIIPTGVIDLFKLYTFIDKLNKPIADCIENNPNLTYYSLENKDGFNLFIQNDDNHYHLKLLSIVDGEEFSLTVRLGSNTHPIDKRVINEVRCQLHKKFNGLSPAIYANELYRSVRSELISILNRTIRNGGKIGFAKTETACIDLILLFGVIVDVKIKTVCKYKVIKTGIDVTIRRRVYGMDIDEYRLSATGDYNGELTRNIVNQMRKIKSLR